VVVFLTSSWRVVESGEWRGESSNLNEKQNRQRRERKGGELTDKQQEIQ